MSTEKIRRHHRIPYTGPVRISWQSADGTRYAMGKCVDVSEGGMRVECPETIALRSMVLFAAEKLKLSGSATVRHVARRGSKYVLGLEVNAALLEKALKLAEQAGAPVGS